MPAAGAAPKKVRAEPFRRLSRSELALTAIPVALGIAAAALWGRPLGLAALAVGLALLAGLGTVLLPTPLRTVAAFVVGLGGAIGWGIAGPPLAIGWLLLYPSAYAVGGHLSAGRRSRPKQRTDPPPPVTVPSQQGALADVEALDGVDHTVVTLRRGAARLDLGGDARGAMMVYHCPDSGARRPQWAHLATRSADAEPVVVRVAGTDGHFLAGQVTSLEPARRAVIAFLTTGDRAPGLDWRTGDEVADLRPPGLQQD